ncbi:hypothetical protein MMIC_P0008 [Mariprofundus micogutta]|uniref:Uncharacterized protein n=1 Tax=Mariprofundus micogutta TaxID=1921010 RepID=A0A1L8CJL6_9PROT|nr:hypothetical protein [Mariprofundus micogutta]GAV19080.1 hypothetical protein MMIC_P0008 [Mariprofundus micogutta]
MSIDRLKKEGRLRWTTLSTITIELIGQADALAVWVFLMSRPDNWKVMPGWTREKLGIGEVRWKKAREELELLGLYQVKVVRDPNTGKLKGREIVIREESTETTESPNFGKNQSSKNSSDGENHAQITDLVSTNREKTTTAHVLLGEFSIVMDGLASDVISEVNRLLLLSSTEQQARFVAAVESGYKSARSLPAWMRSMARKAEAGELGPAVGQESDIEEQRATEIEARVQEIITDGGAGKLILLDGKPAELDDRYVRGEGFVVSLPIAVVTGRVCVSES